MTQILLCSARFVKDNVCNENTYDKYLLVAIREAQETKLMQILGYRLTERLKELVNNNQVSSYPDYADLLNRCQFFLAYSAMAKAVTRLAYKTANIGVGQNTDTNINPAPNNIVEQTRRDYESVADFYANALQGYLIDNRNKFPELSQNSGHETRPTLDSSANTGLWLGGIRGRKI